MRKTALLFTLFFALTALAATEHSVSDIVLRTPPERRLGPSLATDGDGYLAVWQDTREAAASPSLLAARITAAGQVLDPTGIRLTSQSDGPAHVLWNGERYLVFFPIGRTIMLATVDRDGNAAQFHPVIENAADISVATNGSRIIVAYEGDRASVVPPRPFVAVLDMSGFLLGSASVSSFRHENLAPSVVAETNGELVVAWNVVAKGRYTLNAIRLGSGGERRTFAPVAIGTSGAASTLYRNGDAFVAVSSSESWGVSADFTRISTPSTGVTGTVFELQGHAAVAWASAGTVSVASFDADGRAGAPVVVDAGTGSAARVAALQTDGRLFLGWVSREPDRANGDRFLGLLANADSPLLPPLRGPFEVTVSAAPQSDPAIAAGATESLVAWGEPDGVYAGRIDDAGRRLDGRGIRLGESASSGPPAVTFHDGRYAVAFTEESAIVIRFVTPSGVLQPDVVRVAAPAPGTRRIALASGGGALLLAWSDSRDVLVTRVHPSLTTDPPVIVSSDVDGLAVDPAVAWNGAECLIAWVETFTFDRTTLRPTVYARRMSPELGPAGPSIVVADKVGQAGAPVAASDGKDWFVAWEAVYETAIVFSRIAATGEAGPKVIVARGSAPGLAWSGKTLYLAWRPESGAVAVQPLARPGATETIAGRTRSASPFLYEQSGIAWRNGRWIAAYPRLGDEAEGFVPRVFAAIAAARPKGRAIR